MRVRRLTVCAQDAALFAVMGACAFLLRFEFQVPRYYWPHLVLGIVCWVLIKPAFHALGRIDRCAWQHASIPDLVAIVKWNAAASVAAAACIFAVAPSGFPRSVPVIDFFLSVTALTACRMLGRLSPRVTVAQAGDTSGPERVFIYGAGYAGAALVRELREDSGLPYEVRGVIDDNVRTHGSLVQRVPVLGGGDDLQKLAEKHGVSRVFIAMPSCSPEQMTAALLRCRDAQVGCKTVPGLPQLLRDRRFLPQMRDVSMDDVLGRRPVHLDEEHVRAGIEGQVVMVTGAAGSIGSELCRQIARFDPACIVGFEIAETALFHLEQEMRTAFPEVRFECAIGSIQNNVRIKEVIDLYRPVSIFHAAAYKHVPMMEASLIEAVENNVFGTYKVALAAAEAGVRNFVLISSDKAVNPANIMGATKRMAELTIAAVQQTSDTRFISVRFGNVLGSNGSVVPIFLRQIAEGGPVTVTHPEMRRYFMTIPEAAQLVVQASALGRGGEVFVLDMGDQVRIVDLARKLILLSGFRPGKDVEIVFSGTRPGEKLYEELNLNDEQTVPTPHDKIRIFRGTGAILHVHQCMAQLEMLCDTRDVEALIARLCELLPDYVRSNVPSPDRRTHCPGGNARAAAMLTRG